MNKVQFASEAYELLLEQRKGVRMAKQMLKLNAFCADFDVPRSTALKWVHSQGFPAYNLQGHWYVDLAAFYKWREQQHKRCYKYA